MRGRIKVRRRKSVKSVSFLLLDNQDMLAPMHMSLLHSRRRARVAAVNARMYVRADTRDYSNCVGILL